MVGCEALQGAGEVATPAPFLVSGVWREGDPVELLLGLPPLTRGGKVAGGAFPGRISDREQGYPGKSRKSPWRLREGLLGPRWDRGGGESLAQALHPSVGRPNPAGNRHRKYLIVYIQKSRPGGWVPTWGPIPRTPFKLMGLHINRGGAQEPNCPRRTEARFGSQNGLLQRRSTLCRSIQGRGPGTTLPGLLPTPQVTLSGGLLAPHCNQEGLWRDMYAAWSTWS